MIFAFAVSILGFAFVIRITNHLIARDLFTKNEMTKIGTIYFALAIAFVFIFPRTHVAIWFAIFAPLILISLSVIFLLRQRARAFQAIFRDVLSVILLKMRAGRSFRQSLSEVTMETDPRWRAKLSEIASVVVFSQQKARLIADPFVAEIVNELSLVDRQPHAAARRLKVYRDKLRTEDDIRRKSGQILARLRAQSLVMCGLYLAVLIFMISKFGWHANSDLMMGSAALFAFGSLWMWTGGKKKRWRV
jgi:Flp pilus assembly protein TadB